MRDTESETWSSNQRPAPRTTVLSKNQKFSTVVLTRIKDAIVTHVLGALLAAQRQQVVRLVPLAEGHGVDDHDGVLDQRLRAHQLVVARIVHHVNDARLAADPCIRRKQMKMNRLCFAEKRT